jgi:hypothetical protein
MYRETIQWYSGTVKTEEINKKTLFKNIVSQGIDSMGKTRTLAIKYKDTILYVITDPLPPLTVPEKSSYNNNDPAKIITFIFDEKLEIISVTPDRYIVSKAGRIYSIPYNVIRSSTLLLYNENQRIARYLQEYAYYMYSLYARENGMNPDNINKFLREKTVVRENYKYPKISRRFNLDGPYVSGGKLIVLNLEMAQRLGYSIELMMRRDTKKLVEYSSYDLIQEYYLDKNDFTPDNNAVILMTDEALRDWISEQNVEYILRNVPTSTESTFYLSLQGDVALIQCADTFESAVNVARIWNEQGYNSHSVVEDTDSNYSYYVFESPNEITRYGDNANKVIVWREEDELKYGAILSM